MGSFIMGGVSFVVLACAWPVWLLLRARRRFANATATGDFLPAPGTALRRHLARREIPFVALGALLTGLLVFGLASALALDPRHDFVWLASSAGVLVNANALFICFVRRPFVGRLRADLRRRLPPRPSASEPVLGVRRSETLRQGLRVSPFDDVALGAIVDDALQLHFENGTRVIRRGDVRDIRLVDAVDPPGARLLQLDFVDGARQDRSIWLSDAEAGNVPDQRRATRAHYVGLCAWFAAEVSAVRPRSRLTVRPETELDRAWARANAATFHAKSA